MLALTLALSLLVQDSGRIKIDRTGTIHELVGDLQAGSAAAIRVDKDIDPKAVTVKVDGAGFFEALDAICRAHGGARYLNHPTGPEEGKVDLIPGKFLDYPSQYVGDLKVIVTEMTEHRSELAVGPHHWCRVNVVLLGPPWLRVAPIPPAKAIWTLEEAKDADGKDVLPTAADKNPDFRIDLAYAPTLWKGNVVYRTWRLMPFDLAKGLNVLKGKVQITVGDAKEIAIPVEEGRTVETPVGAITLDTIAEKQDGGGPFYRLGLTLKPAAGIRTLKDAIEPRYRLDGEGRENLRWTLDFPNNGMSFTASFRPPKPTTLRLVVRQGERKMDVPFEIKNVRF